MPDSAGITTRDRIPSGSPGQFSAALSPAVRSSREVLGFDLRQDVQVWPGARLVEVVPPGSDVGLVLLPSDSEIPMAVRMGTSDADAAFVRLRSAGAQLHNDHVIVDVKGAPPMFFFADPDGNGLVYLEESRE